MGGCEDGLVLYLVIPFFDFCLNIFFRNSFDVNGLRFQYRVHKVLMFVAAEKFLFVPSQLDEKLA